MTSQKKAKIIWIIDSLRPGGAEQLMVPILNNLQQKFDIRVCALQVREGNPIAHQLEKHGVKVDMVEVPNLRTLSNLPSLIKYLRKHAPDLIHTQLQFADVLGSTAGKILNIPTVSTQHTIESITELSSAGLRQSLSWFCLRNFSKLVIAVSNQTREYHIQNGKLKPEKIITLHNGIEIKNFSNISLEQAQKIRKIHNIPLDAKIITTVAVLREKKGIQFLLSALPEILETNPNTYYVIVGDGEYRTNLEEQVKTNNLSNQVIFTGHKTNVPEYLAAADLFVLPTLIDAFPTVLLEAMAARKPIIASQVGGIPEIIDDGFSGLLVPPENVSKLVEACSTLLSNPEKSAELAENGYQTALKKFSIQNQVKQLEKIYLDLI